MKKKCLVVSGGEYCDFDSTSYDFVIACDKGYEYSKKVGVMPNFIIGDFDSYKGELPSDIPIIKLNTDKDETDTFYAVKYALENGFSEIDVVCAFGGRLDHCIANIQTASYVVEHGGKTTFYGKDETLYCFSKSSIIIPKKEGYSLSVFALTDSCFNVWEKGTKYLLEGATLINKFPIGISNEWVEDFAEISCGSGVLLVVVSKI
ncbi:MAG: thiamine diphosphokinase [Treponema sp.]|nr:thiamine diphosphokinase [Treponema sp.]MBQ7882334.1 thiamine diphosphokinase [Treponema sp.]